MWKAYRIRLVNDFFEFIILANWLVLVVNCIDNWRLEIVVIFISYKMKCCKCKKNYKLFNVKILN